MSKADDILKKYGITQVTGSEGKPTSSAKSNSSTGNSKADSILAKYGIGQVRDGETYDPPVVSKPKPKSTITGYNDADAKLGWNQYLDSQKRKKQEEEEKPWYMKALEWLGQASDTTLPTATTTTVIDNYRKDTSYREPSDNWTAQQKLEFGYLYGQDQGRAWAYAEELNNNLAREEDEKQKAAVKEKALSNPVAHTAGAILTAPLGLADYLDYVAEYNARGKTTEKPGLTPFDYSQTVTGSISEDLNEKHGTLNEDIPIIGGKGWGDVYGLGTSIAQSALSGYTGGQMGTLVQFFGSAAASGIDDAKQRGASDQQALMIGTINGVAEGLAESIGIDNLLKIGSASTMRELLKNIAKQGVSEGLEEGVTTLLNNFADQFVMQDKSNFYAIVNQLVENGMPLELAKQKAWLMMANDMAFDIVGGFVSGTVHAGPQTAYNTAIENVYQPYQIGKYIKDSEGSVDALKQLANEIAGASSADMSQTISDRIAKVDDKQSALRVGKLYETVQKANNLANASANQADIVKSLERKGVSTQVAKVAADAIIAKYNGQELTDAQKATINAIKGNEAVNGAITNIINNPKSTMSQRSNNIRNFNRDVNYGRIAKANGISTDDVKKIAEGKFITAKENGSESHYEVSADGKTIDKDGNVVTIQGIASLEKGRMLLNTENGTVDAGEVAYGSQAEALVYEAVSNLEGIIDTDTANRLSKHLMKLGEVNSDVYARGIVQAYTYGYYGYGREAMMGENSLSATLTEKQRNVAYGLGEQFRDAKTKTDQANAKTATVAKNATTGKSTAPDGTKYQKVVFDSKVKKWGKKQKSEVAYIDFIASNFSGNTVHVFESYKTKDGYFYEDRNGKIHSAPNGMYIAETGDIYLDLNAGNHGEGLIMNTFAHELYHHIQKRSPEKARKLAEFLVQELGYESVEVAVRRQIAKAEAAGHGVEYLMKTEGLSRNAAERRVYDRAFNDFVADSLETMFTEGDAVGKLQKLKSQDEGLFNMIKDFIDKWVKKLREFYNSHSTISIEGDMVRQLEKFDQIQQMFVEALVDAGDNFKSLATMEENTDAVPVESVTEYSYRSLAEAAGFVGVENEDGTRSFMRNGVKVSEVTVDDIEHSPIGAFINYSLAKKDISEAEATRQKKMFADICTMACKTNDFAMTMQFVGSAVFTGMKANADKQYGTTYDFPSICTKTQAVIDAMSKRMVKLGRGLNNEELVKLYQDVFASGNPVPCPECYVFSRWIGIGGLLDNIKKYQDYYGDMKVEDVAKAYRTMRDEVAAFAEEQGISFGKAKGALTSKLTKEYNKLTEKIEKAQNQGEKVKPADQKRLAELEPMMNTVKGMTWLENVYFADSSLKKVNPRFRVPNEVLFDLNNGEAFATQYKEAWAFRTTQGAGYGKAITPYAEARLGEGILVTNNTTNAIKGKAQGSLDNFFLRQNGTMDKKAREALDRARLKQKIQAFIGGQRFQSTSDARYENASDYLLAALEMQAMHGMVQVYTKVDGAVPALAAWNYSINQSLMPLGGGLDENGNVKDTSVGGMNRDIAFRNREKFETAGTITIGVNDNHIRAMFKQLVRDFIIPYHASGGKADVVAAFRSIQEGQEKRGQMVRSTDYSRTQGDKVLSDEVLRWQGKTDSEIQRIHAVRDARIAILTAGKPNMDVVRSNRFLSALYDKLAKGGEWEGVKLAKSKVESQIYPNEFWDQTVSYEDSGNITRDYLEYCNDLGFLHRFSGLVPSNGKLVPVKGYDQNGNRVVLTDLAYKYDENGQKTDQIEEYFWKVLTDRRMYDNHGKYLPQKVVTLNDTTTDTVTNFARGNYGRQYDKELSMKTAEEIAGKMYSDRDYAYDTLVSKPDMVVTKVGEDVPKNRADIIAMAKKNATSVGRFDPKTGSISVHVGDIGKDVVIGTMGLKHGLEGRRTENAIVTLKAGEILQNSIRINELTPKKDNADGSYVLIGAARGSNGDLYIVRSVVNTFKSELMSMDVLYAINAKKGNRLRSMRPGFQGPVTDSTISIAELLDHVNQYFPDILPEEVLKHYGYDARPEGNLGEDVLYSDRVTDQETLDFLNEQLRNGEVTEVYRAMAVDGNRNLYPPMAGYVTKNGKKVINGQPSVIGEWEQSTESIPWESVDEKFLLGEGFKQYGPTKDYPNGSFKRDNNIFYKNKKGEWKSKFHLEKDNGSTVDAAYAPYIHTSLSMLNDQFTSAYKRDNLVVVRGYVPNSEINGVNGKRYQANFADKPVGRTKWHSGVVAAQMPETRTVILSRYFMPIEIVDDAVMAQKTKEMMKGKDIEIPFNVVTPRQRRALEEIGVRIGEARGLKDAPKKADVMYSDRNNAPTFYSQMAKVVDGVKQEKLGASSVVSMLRGKGVKAEEIKWSGIEEWLEGKKSVTKAELQEFIAGSMLQIEEETLTNDEIPYTADQLKRIDEHTAKRDEIAKELAEAWKQVTGDDIPITYFGAGLESSVESKIRDVNLEEKKASFEGRLLEKLRKDLKEVIANNDDFGFDSGREALISIHRHRRAFIDHYELSTADKAVIVKYCNALNAYNELPNKINDEDTTRLRRIAHEAELYNRKIGDVKSEHYAENAKHMTKWGQYKLKGGENYREILFKIPGSSYYNDAMAMHWEERDGVLAHARIQDLNTFLGRMLFIEEVQSDWHNEGHKEGYTSDRDAALDRISELREQWDSMYNDMLEASATEARAISERMDAIDTERANLAKKVRYGNFVPDAPFKDTYHEYVLKRLLREAAEQDYDSIGWTPAEIQVKRWSEKFAEGYRIEYDQEIPKFLNKYGKKWGTKVGKTVLDSGNEVWSMAITDEMKESVLTEGQPLYSERDTESVSNRTLLANAFEGLAQNDIERNKIQEYKSKIDLINAEERTLQELNAQIKELSFAEGKRDKKKISDLRFEAQQAANRINTYDKQLLRLEASKPLQDVLTREKKRAYQKAERRGKEALAEYKKKAVQEQQKIAERYRDNRKKAVAKARETAEKRDAREKLQKLVLDTAKWLSYPTKDDVKCPDLLKPAYKDFLDSIDMSSARLAKGGDPTNSDLRLANAMSSLATALERINASQDPTQETTAVLDVGYLDLPVNFVQKLRDMTEDVKKMMVEGEYVVNTMTAQEVRKLSQMIRTLNHAIREMSTLYANLRFANVEALGDESMSFMDDLGEIKKTSGAKDFVKWDNALPFYAFKRFGKGGESIFEGLMDAQDKLAFLAKKIFNFQENTWKGDEAKKWSEDTHTITLPDSKKELTLTTADAMSIYCLSRRQQGLQHLLGGGVRVVGIQKGSQKAKDSRSTLTIKDIDAIISSLTDRQKKVAEAIQEFMSTTCSEWGNEISMKRFLTREFTEKFYFPIESNDENLPTKDPSAQQSDLFRLLNISATKPIDPRANNEVIIRNIFDVFTGHASDMARLNAFGMPLLDYMKWLNYREKTVSDNGQINVRGVRKSMETAFGGAAKSYVLNLIKDVNGRPSDNGDPSVLMKWMRSAKTASVGSSLRVATLQVTAYPRAALVLSPKSLALGLSKIPRIEKAKKYCGIALWKSFGFYDTNISRSIEDQMKGVKDVKQKLIELSLKGAEIGDAVTWGALWNACEYEVAATKQYKVGTDEFYEAVGKKLREVVYRTQVVDSTLTRSQIMRSKRGMAQETAAFMSEPTLSANILMDAGMEFSMEKRRTNAKTAWNKTGKYVTRAIAVYSIGQLTAALMEGLWDAWRDDEDEEFGEKYVSAFLENLALDLVPFNKVPIVSDVFEAALAMFDIGYYSSDKMSTTWLTQAVSAADTWRKVLGGKSSVTTYNALYKTVRAVSSFYGVSFSGVMREAVALWNNTAGAYDLTWKILTYDRSKSELANLLLDALVEGDDRQADSLRSEFADDEVQNAIRSAVKNRYDEAEIDRNTAVQYLVNYGGLEKTEAEKKIAEWGFKTEYDFAWSDRKQSYLDGKISARDLKTALMEVGGMTAEEADEYIEKLDFEADHPELSEKITFTQYKRWQTDGQPNGVSLELFTDVAEYRDDGTSNSVKSQDEVRAYIESVTISNQMRHALWCCFYKASTSPYN